jgi:hypothetical protein
MWILIQATRAGAVPWRSVIRLALPATIAMPISAVLAAGQLLKDYNTAVPLETFQAMAYVGIAMSTMLLFVLMCAASAIVCTFYPEAVDSLRASNRRHMAIDAAAALLAVIAFAIALHQWDAWMMDRFHAHALFSIAAPDIIVSAAPAVSAVAGAVRSLLTNAALLGLIAILWQHFTRLWMRIAALVAAACAMLPSDIHEPGEFVLHFVIAAVSLAAAYAFCRYFGRRNYLAYALVFWLFALRTPLMELLGNSNGALEVQAWILCAVIGGTIVWALAPALRDARAPRPVSLS